MTNVEIDSLKNKIAPWLIYGVALFTLGPLDHRIVKNWHELMNEIDQVDDKYDNASGSQKKEAVVENTVSRILSGNNGVTRHFSKSGKEEYCRLIRHQFTITQAASSRKTADSFSRTAWLDGAHLSKFFIAALPEDKKLPGNRLKRFSNTLAWAAGTYKLLDSIVDIEGDSKNGAVSVKDLPAAKKALTYRLLSQFVPAAFGLLHPSSSPRRQT